MSELKMPRVARVTDADIERLVRRDYPPGQVADVMTLLDGYAGSDPARVRAAVLKLADASVDALVVQLDVAACDFRDVLGPAEYPEYLRRDYAEIRKLSETELQKIYDQDWQQYQGWFEADDS